MSAILTPGIAQSAFELVKPVFDTIVESKFLSLGTDMHIMVLDSVGGVLHSEDWGPGNPANVRNAKGMATLCFKHKMSCRDIEQNAPWLYEPGDCRNLGGVYQDGLVVSAYGQREYFNEMLSWMALSAIQALCRSSMILAHTPAGFFLH